MSKSAIKTINAAVSGNLAAFLVGHINNPVTRQYWPNADRLAIFLLDTVANAYQCENSTTFAANGFRDMDHAIESYIESNLADWRDCQFRKPLTDVINRLCEMAFNNAAFEAKQRNAKTVHDVEEARSLARKIDRLIGNLDCLPECVAPYGFDADDVNLVIALNQRLFPELIESDIAVAHNRALRREICMGLLYEGQESAFMEKVNACGYDAEEVQYMRGVVARVQALETQHSDAKHDAHYYELLLAKRQRKGQVVMTTKEGAFSYILNDAIAGDMVRAVDLHQMVIDFRDGSVLSLRDGSWMPHGFYAATQDKRC